MYRSKTTRYLLLLMLMSSVIVAGEAHASPAASFEAGKIEERIAYAASLNPTASVLMNWYGSLIAAEMNQLDIRFSSVDPEWHQYRNKYPEHINAVQIVDADIRKQEEEGEYRFEVEVLVTYMKGGLSRNRLLREAFLIHLTESEKPRIKQVVSLAPDEEMAASDTEQSSAFNKRYYKGREFAYAWLAFMDGVKAVASTINTDQWFDRASYTAKIGSFEVAENVASSLKKRNKQLGRGGHLLRSVTVNSVEGKPRHFELDLIIDWKGVNPDGTPVIAKIHQLIQYEQQDDASWVVLSIQEKHLLPDLKPWQNLLC